MEGKKAPHEDGELKPEFSNSEPTERIKEVSLAEHLAIQRASLEKKHKEEISSYEQQLNQIEHRMAAMRRDSGLTVNKSLNASLENTLILIKLERYQLIKKLHSFLKDILNSVSPFLPQDLVFDLSEKCSLEHVDKVTSFNARSSRSPACLTVL